MSAHTAAVERALAHAAIVPFVARLSARLPADAVPWPEARLAAVAAILRVTDEPELLFIRRAEVEHDPWSGHMAFPGGRHETSDTSLEMTAIRETFEELSLDLGVGRMLGRLDDLAPRSHALPPIIIRPFVAIVPPDMPLAPSREVAATFWVPLHRLRALDAQVEHAITVNGVRARFPAYAVGEHVVWGLTERIVRQLLSMFDE